MTATAVLATSAARDIAVDGDVQRLAGAMRRFVGGPAERFEEYGRLQLIALLRRGLAPDSVVIDVGCGTLRAGYWLIHFLESRPLPRHRARRGPPPAAREVLLEPGLEEVKRPRFDLGKEFDLGVFGMSPDFVLARSIWSHASKQQIGAMLDSFASVATPGALLLASYLPADRPRRPVPASGSRTAVARLARCVRGRLVTRGGGTARASARGRDADYLGDAWSERLVAHDPAWVNEACRYRGLVAHESAADAFGVQVWLEIRKPLTAEAAGATS